MQSSTTEGNADTRLVHNTTKCRRVGCLTSEWTRPLRASKPCCGARSLASWLAWPSPWSLWQVTPWCIWSVARWQTAHASSTWMIVRCHGSVWSRDLTSWSLKNFVEWRSTLPKGDIFTLEASARGRFLWRDFYNFYLGLRCRITSSTPSNCADVCVCVHSTEFWLVIELTGFFDWLLLYCCLFFWLGWCRVEWLSDQASVATRWVKTAPGWYLPTKGRFCKTCCCIMLCNRLVGIYSGYQIR